MKIILLINNDYYDNLLKHNQLKYIPLLNNNIENFVKKNIILIMKIISIKLSVSLNMFVDQIIYDHNVINYRSMLKEKERYCL